MVKISEYDQAHDNRLHGWLVHWGLTPQQQPGSYRGGDDDDHDDGDDDDGDDGDDDDDDDETSGSLVEETGIKVNLKNRHYVPAHAQLYKCAIVVYKLYTPCTKLYRYRAIHYTYLHKIPTFCTPPPAVVQLPLPCNTHTHFKIYFDFHYTR